jgi:hypothetical protein
MRLALASRAARWGEFSPIGKLFPLDSSLKITEMPKFLAYFFRRKELFFNFGKKRFWPHFGHFFQKLIWSACSQASYEAAQNNKRERVESVHLRFSFSSSDEFFTTIDCFSQM